MTIQQKTKVAAASLSEAWVELRGTPITTFVVCFIGLTVSTADQALFSYAIPDLSAEFEVSLEVVGVILTISFIAASIAVVIIGGLTDYIGRRRIFIFLLASSATCVGIHSIVESLEMIALFRILGFALSGGLFPIAITTMIEVAPARFRGLLGGFLQISYPLGFFVASLFAAPLIEHYSWRVIFYPAFLVVPLAFLLGRILKEPERFQKLKRDKVVKTSDDADSASPLPNRSVAKHFGELLSPRFATRSIICFSGTMLISLAIGGITYFLPTFLVEDRELSASAATQLSGLINLIGVPGYVIVAILGEFFLTRRQVLVLWIWLGALSLGLSLWFAFDPMVLMLSFGLTIMFLYGSEAVRAPLIGEIFPTRIRATATSVVGSLGVTTGWLTAPLLLTHFEPLWGWTVTWTVFAVAPVILAGFLFLALPNFPSGIEIEDV